MSKENSFEKHKGKALSQDAVSDSYSIIIDSVSNFRYELIKMIEKVRYNVDGHENLSSSQIAEIFERKINSH